MKQHLTAIFILAFFPSSGIFAVGARVKDFGRVAYLPPPWGVTNPDPNDPDAIMYEMTINRKSKNQTLNNSLLASISAPPRMWTASTPL